MNQSADSKNRKSQIAQSPDHPITRLPAPRVTHYPISVIGGFDAKDEEN
jgi:hypothetical protein